MNDAKLEKQKAKLVEAKLMDEQDTLIDFLQAGLLNADIVIPYKNIKELEKCSQGFMPIGISITHEDMETGKITTDKISMMKRDKWMSFITEKAGL